MCKNITKICIPARMQARRFPNKPLVDVCGVPMVMRVYKQAIKANMGDVIVACGDKIIYDTVIQHGGIAVMTDRDLPSGTDRIYQAVSRLGHSVDTVLNVQGDIPTISPAVIIAVHKALQSGNYDMATACAKIVKHSEIHNPNVVKAYGNFNKSTVTTATAFLRTAQGSAPFYHHIGLYGYTMDALARFVALPPSKNEIIHRLEQLRAVDAGFKIALQLVDDVPFGVDTPADLQAVRNFLQNP